MLLDVYCHLLLYCQISGIISFIMNCQKYHDLLTKKDVIKKIVRKYIYTIIFFCITLLHFSHFHSRNVTKPVCYKDYTQICQISCKIIQFPGGIADTAFPFPLHNYVTMQRRKLYNSMFIQAE